jgi:hypothetical protein
MYKIFRIAIVIIFAVIIFVIASYTINFSEWNSPLYSLDINESKQRGVFIAEYRFINTNIPKKHVNSYCIDKLWMERQFINTTFFRNYESTRVYNNKKLTQFQVTLKPTCPLIKPSDALYLTTDTSSYSYPQRGDNQIMLSFPKDYVIESTNNYSNNSSDTLKLIAFTSDESNLPADCKYIGECMLVRIP